MTQYDYYNREERAICAHLFRLLHERLEDRSESPLGQFIGKLLGTDILFKNGYPSLSSLKFDNIAIYCEVSVIRDVYQDLKPRVTPFLDDLTRLIMNQEKVTDCRLYSQLPESLNNPRKTHPKQIGQKAKAKNIQLNKDENAVFGSMQGMFNAKPDLVITVDNILLVCEAKHTKPFDEEQLIRTWKIAEVWATLLYKDFGFSEPPIYSVFKLGAAEFHPHIHWTDISRLAENIYGKEDRSRIAIEASLELLKRYNLE